MRGAMLADRCAGRGALGALGGGRVPGDGRRRRTAGGLRAGCGRGAQACGTSPRAAGRAPRACVAHAIRASRFDANSAIESAEAAMRRRADARHWTAQARRTRGRVPFPRRARPHGPPIQRVSTSSPSRPQPVGRSRRAVSGRFPLCPPASRDSTAHSARAFRGPPRAAPALTLRPRRPATRRRARSSATATGSSRRARRDRGTWSRACDRTRSPLR